MKDKIEELINLHVQTDCPLCGEEMITLPGSEYIKEGSRWGYHTYHKSCLICDHKSQTVKIHGKFIHEVNRKDNVTEFKDMIDITPYGESILKRLIRWITPSNEIR